MAALALPILLCEIAATRTADVANGRAHTALLVAALQIPLLLPVLLFLPTRKLGASLAAPGVWRLLGGFAALGLGVTLVLDGWLPRLAILGDPSRATRLVVLAVLPIAGGVGDLMLGSRTTARGRNVLWILFAAAVLATLIWFAITRSSSSLPTTGLHPMAVTLLLAATGLALGPPLPGGIRRLAARSPDLGPWAWIAYASGAALACAVAGSVLAADSNVNVLIMGTVVWLAGVLAVQPIVFGSADASPRTPTVWPAGHFYSPLPNLDEVRADEHRIFTRGQRELRGIDLGIDRQRARMRELAVYYGEEDFPDRPRADRRYCATNDFFAYGDAFFYYALVRQLRPRRVIEIGSGWSSAVLLDTDERFLGSSVDCTFIEPFPERLLSLLRPADVARVRLVKARVQDVPLDDFEALCANDILFVDSSHVCKTGSDVHHILFEILPRLRSGVWVHVHDVFENFEYLRSWVLEGRAWNESYVLRAFLMYNPEWTIELHGATLATVAGHELSPLMPRVGACPGGSIWLRRR